MESWRPGRLLVVAFSFLTPMYFCPLLSLLTGTACLGVACAIQFNRDDATATIIERWSNLESRMTQQPKHNEHLEELDISLLHPHPDNPRIAPREDVITA